ncbi:MAG: phosphoribosylanthranilate isomerase [Candidatus Gastranaerophilales bacterium]|nr:phosphoribosylanthranilate isomerase [Candidatus Gastranaerophilales bacterium]
MKIKICGIKTEEEAKIMNLTMPDFIGFVFAESKRQIDYKRAEKLKNILNPDIKRTGVFVSSGEKEILNLWDKGIIQIAQLHGYYSEDTIKSLKSEGLSVIKVVRVKEKKYEIETNADYLLFDCYSNSGMGGVNKTFDWNIQIKANVPFFAAGGLNASNIKEMSEKLKPYAVDISSGAEENGIKTLKKVSDIMKVLRGITV